MPTLRPAREPFPRPAIWRRDADPTLRSLALADRLRAAKERGDLGAEIERVLREEYARGYEDGARHSDEVHRGRERDEYERGAIEGARRALDGPARARLVDRRSVWRRIADWWEHGRSWRRRPEFLVLDGIRADRDRPPDLRFGRGLDGAWVEGPDGIRRAWPDPTPVPSSGRDRSD